MLDRTVIKLQIILPILGIIGIYVLISIISLSIQLYIKNIFVLTLIPFFFGFLLNLRNKEFKIAQKITLKRFLKNEAIGVLLNNIFNYIPSNPNAGKLFLKEAIKKIYEKNKILIKSCQWTLMVYLILISVILIILVII